MLPVTQYGRFGPGIEEIHKAFDGGDHAAALAKAKSTLSEVGRSKANAAMWTTMELAGLLIDIGISIRSQSEIELGIALIQSNLHKWQILVTRSSLEYNLGNARDALHALETEHDEMPFRAQNMDNLLAAKNHFWRAYKWLDPTDLPFRRMVLNNLANTLLHCRRFAEALHFYSLNLTEDPTFPETNASRADALWIYSELCNARTSILYWQVARGFEVAAQSSSIPATWRKRWSARSNELFEWLNQSGERDFEHDLGQTEVEASSHSMYRKFVIEEHLALCEHALYCNCIGSRFDNLCIATQSKPIAGVSVPKMEQVLNRLKAEFCTLRLLYYQATSDNRTWNTIDFDAEVMFSDVFDGEIATTQIELIRIVQRSCFGILDKIAVAICELFSLRNPNDRIYFDRFLTPLSKERAKPKYQELWMKLNEIDNPFLVALYSQAIDFNQDEGEWGYLKVWRNTMEHKNLIIVSDDNVDQDILSEFPSTLHGLKVKHGELVCSTLRMLHFTRSAIFNYAWCVRWEGAQELARTEGNPGPVYRFSGR